MMFPLYHTKDDVTSPPHSDLSDNIYLLLIIIHMMKVRVPPVMIGVMKTSVVICVLVELLVEHTKEIAP